MEIMANAEVYIVTFLGLPRVVIGIRERNWMIELKEGERNQKRERERERD